MNDYPRHVLQTDLGKVQTTREPANVTLDGDDLLRDGIHFRLRSIWHRSHVSGAWQWSTLIVTPTDPPAPWKPNKRGYDAERDFHARVEDCCRAVVQQLERDYPDDWIDARISAAHQRIAVRQQRMQGLLQEIDAENQRISELAAQRTTPAGVSPCP